MRLLIALVLAASSLPAQYFDFAVTDDGRLYFSTPLTTGSENSRSKIYRLADGRPELFASGSDDDNPFGNTVRAPLVSGDGSITGWALTLPCSGGSCGLSGLPRTSFHLQGAGIDTLTVTGLQISRNGRFLLASTYDAHVRLIELPSQRATDLGQFFSVLGQQSIADNGAALIWHGQVSRLFYRPPGGEARPVPGADDSVSGVLSPAGDRIAFERTRDGRFELVLGESVLASAPLRFSYQPRFANDGTLLYIHPDGQPMIVPPGGEPRRLVSIESGVHRAILSGDGRIAWLASGAGQLLRVRVADAAVEEVIPATPFVTPGGLFATPGSVVRFTGPGLARDTRFRIGDLDLPLSDLSPRAAYVQIPWEYPGIESPRPLIVQGRGSPFFQKLDFTPLARPTVTFERQPFSISPVAAHQDFRGLIDAADPAAPGETIHVFARNLGPVDPPVATGQRSPDPPARITTPLACYLFEVEPNNFPVRPRGLVVPFAGLSGGLVGIYHIDVTIPADWQTSQAMLRCVVDSGDGPRGDWVPLDVSPRRPDQP
jgi:uncharacterized protein (TIGR03437 family)